MMVRGMWHKIISGTGVALLLTLLAGIGQADAWWDAKWQYRKKVAFDTSDKGAAIKESITDAPVLVRLHTGNFVFANAKKDGSDIRFVSADDKALLKFHLEKYDPKQEIALAWVKVPRITGSAAQDSIWLYYGNESISGGQESGGTYDTSQVLTYHLGEAEGTPKDATAYANHASILSGVLGAPSIIGNAAAFKAGEEKIVVAQSPSLNFAKGFSFSAWIKCEQPQKGAQLFAWQEGTQSLVIGIEGDKIYSRLAVNGKPPVRVEGATAIPLTSWHHVAVSAEPNKRMVVYLDGRESGAANLPVDMPSYGAEITMGSSFAGILDEIQIANVARPAAWFAAAAAGQGQDGKLTAYMQEESGKGGEDNLTIRLIKVTARSITFDGWMIIGLCTVMLFMAAGVFINKFMRLQKIRQGNKSFLESFNQLHDPLELDQQDEEFEHSNLYKVYQAGYERIMNWAENQHESKEEVTLTPLAMNIFRAALDRSHSDELKKMNAWMIVLTLGISGGPFWGLLGTVWGVMNTFASLAEAGEANLSAIAPGVASALACTLFGLFVAIPSLFAYSILVLYMKNLNIETRHFIEEYSLRVEGFHGEERG